jgi:multimeric flavodoxin WrbA
MPRARCSSGSCATDLRPVADARLLVVWHSKSGRTHDLLDAVLAGARDPDAGDVEVRDVPALEAAVDDVRWASGLILGTPANFGYMSGALKHFFDTVYDDLQEQTRGLPYALFVKGRSDTDGAVAAVQKIVKGLGWKEVQAPLSVVGDVTAEDLARCTELGQTMAAGLGMGIF